MTGEHGVGRLVGVHPDSATAGGVHYDIGALAGEDPDPHAASAFSAHLHPVGAVVQQEPHFLGLVVVEAAGEIGCRRLAALADLRERDLGDAGVHPGYRGDLVSIGAVHFHFAGQVVVVVAGGLGQLVAPG